MFTKKQATKEAQTWADDSGTVKYIYQLAEGWSVTSDPEAPQYGGIAIHPRTA